MKRLSHFLSISCILFGLQAIAIPADFLSNIVPKKARGSEIVSLKERALKPKNYGELTKSDQLALSCIQESCTPQNYYLIKIGLQDDLLILSDQDWDYFESNYSRIKLEFDELLSHWLEEEFALQNELEISIQDLLNRTSYSQLSAFFESEAATPIRFLKALSLIYRDFSELLDNQFFSRYGLLYFIEGTEQQIPEKIRPALLAALELMNAFFRLNRKTHQFDRISEFDFDGYLEIIHPNTSRADAIEKFKETIHNQIIISQNRIPPLFREHISLKQSQNFLDGNFKEDKKSLQELSNELFSLSILNFAFDKKNLENYLEYFNYPLSAIIDLQEFKESKSRPKQYDALNIRLKNELLDFCSSSLAGAVSAGLDDRFYNKNSSLKELEKVKTLAIQSIRSIHGLSTEDRIELQEKVRDFRFSLPPSRKESMINIKKQLQEHFNRILNTSNQLRNTFKNTSLEEKILFSIWSYEKKENDPIKNLEKKYSNASLYYACLDLLPRYMEDYTNTNTKFINISKGSYKHSGALFGVLSHEIGHHIYPLLKEQEFHKCSLSRYSKQKKLFYKNAPGEQYLPELFADQFATEILARAGKPLENNFTCFLNQNIYDKETNEYLTSIYPGENKHKLISPDEVHSADLDRLLQYLNFNNIKKASCELVIETQSNRNLIWGGEEIHTPEIKSCPIERI